MEKLAAKEKTSNIYLRIIFRSIIFVGILESLIVLIITYVSGAMSSLNEIHPAAGWFIAFPFILSLLFTVILIVEKCVRNTLLNKINKIISQMPERIFWGILIFGLILIALLIEFIFLFPTTKYLHVNDLYQLLFITLTPTLILAVLYGIQGLGFLAYLRSPNWNQIWSNTEIKNMFFGFLILLFTLMYWEILFIQSQILSSIPYWFKPVIGQQYPHRYRYLFPFLLLVFGGARVVYSKSISIYIGMLILIIFGFGFQFMFGLAAGDGFVSMQKSYSERPISHPIKYACSNNSIIDDIKFYEGHYAESYRVQTKPPGFLTGHKIFAKFSNFLTGSQSEDECIANYPRIGSYLFPILASLVIIPITFISKKYFNLEYPLLPAFLYLLTPNFMIWVLVPDQVVFPLIFVINIMVMYLTIKNNSFLMAMSLGVVVYISSFITFAMLPSIGLFCIWLTASYVTYRGNRNRTRIFKLFLGFVLGFGITYLIFYYSLNYNPIHRYQMATYYHREIKDYAITLHTIIVAFVNNSVEYFTWTGIPLFFLVASFCIKSIYKISTGNHEDIHIFTLSSVLLYFALNVLSQTHGEVQRMWIFLSPVIVIIAVAELNDRFNNNHKIVVLSLLVIQFCTAIWSFQFILNQYNW